MKDLEKYQVREKLGKGGFATTYLAADDEKLCVIKHLTLKKSESIKILELIRLEGKVMARLDHPMIPLLFDFIIEESGEDVNIYIIQEFIEGRNLLQLVKEGRQFSEKEVLKIAIDLSKLLEYLHGFSPTIIHRDIKPENIIIDKDGGVYLIDFGAVKEKIAGSRFSKLGISTIIGTQGYMPIEQFEGRTVPASDIYALGLTLVFLLSGTEIYHMEKDGLNLNFRPHVKISGDFALILEQMIEADWKKRYKTASELKEDLLLLLQVDNKDTDSERLKFISRLVKAELVKGEKLKWKGWVDNRYIFFKSGSGFLLLLLIFTPFVLIFFSKAPHPGILLTLAVALLTGLPVVYKRYKKLKNLIYAVTNRRILVIENGRVKFVRSYSSKDLDNMVIEEKLNIDGSSDLLFRKKPYTITEGENMPGIMRIYMITESKKKPLPLEFKMVGIKNIGFVNKLLANLSRRNISSGDSDIGPLPEQ
jgi:serine/threonine protein kinase